MMIAGLGNQMITIGNERSGAAFSPCWKWRYQLWRRWSDDPLFIIIGLNPSTADEAYNDPTITRCIGFAKRERYGGLLMLNLFAFRATAPADLKEAQDPIGPDNDAVILSECQNQERVIVAWGNHGGFCGRDRIISTLLNSSSAMVECFGVTQLGCPRHPLYLKKDTPLVSWPG